MLTRCLAFIGARLILVAISVFVSGHFSEIFSQSGGGPVVPEVTKFGTVSIGSNNYVDYYTGDFVYSLPLMEVHGRTISYPIVLTYRSGIKVSEEASWVGLGWNIPIPGIVRSINLLPDDMVGGAVVIRYQGNENNRIPVYTPYELITSWSNGTLLPCYETNAKFLYELLRQGYSWFRASLYYTQMYYYYRELAQFYEKRKEGIGAIECFNPTLTVNSKFWNCLDEKTTT